MESEEFFQHLKSFDGKDDQTAWALVDVMVDAFFVAHPELDDSSVLLREWLATNRFGKGRRLRAMAISAAYARELSVRLGDGGAWERVRHLLKDFGYSPPADFHNWAMRDRKKSLQADRFYELAKSDISAWTDEQLQDWPRFVDLVGRLDWPDPE
ncbi:MAG: hypothetical protein AAFY84_07215 [Pseudomonadota bacterium]